MTRRVPSVKTANKATKMTLLSMVAMMLLTIAVTAADAALPKGDLPLSKQEEEADRFYQFDAKEAQWTALANVSGPLTNAQMGAVFKHQPEDMVARAKRPKNVAQQAAAHGRVDPHRRVGRQALGPRAAHPPATLPSAAHRSGAAALTRVPPCARQGLDAAAGSRATPGPARASAVSGSCRVR